CAARAVLPSVQKGLLERHRLHTALSGEYERLRSEAEELDAQNAALGAERDRLGADTLRLGQERDRALAAAAALGGTLDVREGALRDRDARLAAIYASTTWKLYRSYATSMDFLVRRPLGSLKRRPGG